MIPVVLFYIGGITQGLKTAEPCAETKILFSKQRVLFKGVNSRIVIEKMMRNEDGSGLIDYKFYCFHREPKFLYVSSDMRDHLQAHISFYNMDLSNAAFQRKDYNYK